MRNPLRPIQRFYGAVLDLREERRLERLSRPLPLLLTRDELPLLLNLRNLRGEGAEIGVQRATFSSHLLGQWGGARLHSIDPWSRFDDPSYVDGANAPDEIQESHLRLARERLAPFGDRAEIHRMTSAEAAPAFADGSLDFVYIDAQHHYEAVVEDLTLWFPKLRPGGLLAGHDYLDGEVRGTRFGVKRAVDEFAANRGLDLGVTLERDYPSWFCFVPRATTAGNPSP